MVRQQRDGDDGDGARRRRWRHPNEQRPPPRSFGYKYRAPPHRSRDAFTYARPLTPLYMRDLDRAPGHVSKFNGLSYNNDIYGDDGWGGDDDDEGKGRRQGSQSDEAMRGQHRRQDNVGAGQIDRRGGARPGVAPDHDGIRRERVRYAPIDGLGGAPGGGPVS